MSIASDPNRMLTDEELTRLHADDVHAGRIVVSLMAGVFMTGLLMYAFICWLAM
jgi:hypothetical protein